MRQVCDFYEEQLEGDSLIVLIDHFNAPTLACLVHNLQFEPVFKIAYQLVLVSLLEQEWKQSLQLLSDLCLQCVSDGELKDSHV